jgi:hypothetical protein
LEIEAVCTSDPDFAGFAAGGFCPCAAQATIKPANISLKKNNLRNGFGLPQFDLPGLERVRHKDHDSGSLPLFSLHDYVNPAERRQQPGTFSWR